MTMHESQTVGMDYFQHADHSYTAVVEIDASPEQVFASFENEHDWPQWALPITKVEWTSPKPFGLGTTRRVFMMGGLVADEVFIAWEYPKRMAFCFTHSSQKLVGSFAEDYIVEALANGKTRVQWNMAMTPQGFGKISMALSRPFMAWGLQWMLNRFKKQVETSNKA